MGRLIGRSAAGTTRCRDCSAATSTSRNSTCATALTYKPDSVISLLFLAETLIKRDRKSEARTTLDAAIAAPPDPAWIPEDTRFKAEARRLLATLAR